MSEPLEPGFDGPESGSTSDGPGVESQPFDAQPFDVQPRSVGGGGCGRYALLGCGGVIILVAILMLIAVLRARDLVVWSLGALQTQVEAALPPDVDERDRERLDLAFESALRAIEAGTVEPAAMQALQGALLQFAGTAQANLTREDVLNLIGVLERVGGLEVPPEHEEEDEGGVDAPLAALVAEPGFA